MGRLIVWTNAHPIKIKNAIGETLFNCGVEYKAKSLGTKIPEVEAGDVILAMGQKTLDIVQKSGMVAKNRKIGSMRGQEIKIHSGKCSIFFTYDPGLIAIDSGRKPDIQWDTQLCIRKALTGTIDPEVGVYKYVTDYTKDIEYINKMYAQTKRKVGISVDLETVGLDPWAEEVFIVSIALTVKEGHSSVIRFSSAIDPTQPAMIKLDVKKPYNKALNAELLHQIEWLMSTPKASLKGANFKFDMNWMQRHWGISDYSNYKMDTTLIGSLLDENRSNSLNNHAKTYTQLGGYDDKFNSTQDKSRMDLVPDVDLLPYAGGDTDACLRVADSMRKHLVKDKRLKNFYIHLLQPASKAFQVIEHRGMVVDVAQYEVLRHQVNIRIQETSKAFLEKVPPRIKRKYADNLSPTRAALLNDFLFGNAKHTGSPTGLHPLGLKPLMKTAKSGKPSTAMEHMELLEDKYPEQMGNIIELLRDYNSATKTMSTYIVGFLKHLRSDGRFHATYHLYKGASADKDVVGTNCLTGDTLITTDSGCLYYNDVVLGSKVLTHTGLWEEVIDKVDNGFKNVIKVTLSTGQQLTTTHNHKYYINGVWITADALEVGDRCTTYGDAESWANIPEWPYMVSSWGRVKSSNSGLVLKTQTKDKWKHQKITLSRGNRVRGDNNRKDFLVHRLVASAFISNPLNLPEVRHKDSMGGNNYACNLIWGTSKDNSIDAVITGSTSKVDTPQSKLDWSKVEYIRSTPNHKTDQSIADELGVSRRLIGMVRSYKRWVYTEPVVYTAEFSTGIITNIELLGSVQTYGLTVDSSHSHVTNGIITHNTGRLSATNPAVQCQPGYSKVLTSEGYKSIDEINLLVFGGAEVKVLTAKGNYKKVLSVFDNGVKPIYEIKTKMGNTIHCTGNHPILTSTGYILADSLELGYTVYRYTYFTGQYAKILRFIRTSISRFKSFIQGHTS